MAVTQHITAGRVNQAFSTNTNNWAPAGEGGCLFINANESLFQITYRTAGTFSNFYANIKGNTIAGGTSTISFRKNGTTGSQVIIIPPGSTGEFTDLTHTDVIAAGDKINYQVVTNGTAGTLGVYGIGANFAPNSNTVNKFTTAINNSSLTVSGTNYLSIVGNPNSVIATEAQRQFKIKTPGTFANMCFNCRFNTRITTTTLLNRKNGTDGAVTISIGSGSTGIFEDIVNTDVFAMSSSIVQNSLRNRHRKCYKL